MTPRRGRPSLAQRTAGPVEGATEGRHCWVNDPPGVPGRWPGLLTEWRRAGEAWEGLVVFATSAAGRPAMVQAWVAADRLEGVQFSPGVPGGPRS